MKQSSLERSDSRFKFKIDKPIIVAGKLVTPEQENNLRQVPKVTEVKMQDTKKSDAKKPTPDGSLTRIILDQNSL